MSSEEPSVHAQPRDAGTIRPAETPVFDALAAQWRATGRAVPGAADPEWEELVAAKPRRRRTPPRWVPQQRL
ncbi:hypothetical protein [Streptacidiphilus sp. MAP12-16]|uniref:hypothetical protein n=1 Tax=Streptacidiphilus sp. MAP12-16 TaxID=3156300 RepID=UPI0035198F7B